MVRPSLDEELLSAIREAPDRRIAQFENLVGSPRTNFGRRVTKGLRSTLRRLVEDGLVEDDRGAYRLSEGGRRRLAEAASEPRGRP